jgi:uncharacterized protein (TIGR00730 family)
MGRSVCVFCGSSVGNDAKFANAAKELGRSLAIAGYQVVCGGSSIGLMRCIADAALEIGGRVIGVRPNWLFEGEPPHAGLTKLHEVSSLHQRKQLMFDLSDAFVVLPGGLGTVDELFEVLSWSHLGLHNKPIIAVDIDGFWNPIFDLIRQAERSGFIRARDASLLRRVFTSADAVAMLTDIFLA